MEASLQLNSGEFAGTDVEAARGGDGGAWEKGTEPDRSGRMGTVWDQIGLGRIRAGWLGQ
jgi:hypothetical protein